MRIVEDRFFPGPNRHAYRPTYEAVVDLSPWQGAETAQLPGFCEGLLARLPGLAEHVCSRGEPGGFVARLREGTRLGHVAEHVALELLHQGGEAARYGKTRLMAGARALVAIESETEAGGRLALRLALALVTALAAGDGRWDDRFPEWIERFRDHLDRWRLGPSTRAVVEAARRRGIPVCRLDDRNLVRLGEGCRQRRLMATLTDGTSVVGAELAQDKAITKRLLAAFGIPVPEGEVVDDWPKALRAFRGLGAPVVVKPLRGSQGRGVSMGLMEEAAVRAAFFRAAAVDGRVVVERQIPGRAVRLLVINGEMVAAAERIPPEVVGDGQSTVAALIDRLNRHPWRGDGHARPLSRVQIDAGLLEELARQGLSLDGVPAAGRRVRLRATANLSTGASAKDVTAQIGRGLARDAVRAAACLGLDVAGVDVVTPSLAETLAEAGGAVVEVNAAPGIRMHLYPSEGSPQPVAERLLDYLFPPGSGNGRIPTVAVTGTNGKTTVTRMVAHVLQSLGRRVGMTTTDGVYIDGQLIQAGDLTGPWSARLVLGDPTVEVAVLETARGGIARGGLGFDACDVAVVTNIGEDHLGQDGVETVDDLVHLKSLVVEVVRPEGAAVLNADDPRVMAMAGRTRGRVVWFSCLGHNLAVHKALAAGGEAVFVERGTLVYGRAQQRQRLLGVRVLPVSLGGIADFNVANAAAAAAACIALGVAPRAVARALAAFRPGADGNNRGRLEVWQQADLRLLIDYGHNLPALTALGAVCSRLRRRGREVVTVLGLPGDRRNQDLLASAQAVAGFSDRVVVREDRDRRGRGEGEVAALLVQGLRRAGMAPGRIALALDEAEAVRLAIRMAEPGALVVILFERYEVAREALEGALIARAAMVNAPQLIQQG